MKGKPFSGFPFGLVIAVWFYVNSWSNLKKHRKSGAGTYKDGAEWETAARFSFEHAIFSFTQYNKIPAILCVLPEFFMKCGRKRAAQNRLFPVLHRPCRCKSDKPDDCHLGCVAATGLFPMLRIEKPFFLFLADGELSPSAFVRRLADKSATADNDIGPRRIKKAPL